MKIAYTINGIIGGLVGRTLYRFGVSIVKDLV